MNTPERLTNIVTTLTWTQVTSNRTSHDTSALTNILLTLNKASGCYIFVKKAMFSTFVETLEINKALNELDHTCLNVYPHHTSSLWSFNVYIVFN